MNEPQPPLSPEEQVERFSKTLAMLPVSLGHVYRGYDVRPGALASYAPGVVVFENRFVSASRDTPSFGNTWFTIVSKSGRALSPVSPHPEEKEVVFDRPSLFRVLGFDEDQGVVNITLLQILEEELPQHVGSTMASAESAELSQSRDTFYGRDRIPSDRKSKLARERQDFPVGMDPDGNLCLVADTPFVPPPKPFVDYRKPVVSEPWPELVDIWADVRPRKPFVEGTPAPHPGLSPTPPPHPSLEQAIAHFKPEFAKYYRSVPEEHWDGWRFDRGWVLFPWVDPNLPETDRLIGGVGYLVDDTGRIFQGTSSLYPPRTMAAVYLRDYAGVPPSPEVARSLADLDPRDPVIWPFDGNGRRPE